MDYSTLALPVIEARVDWITSTAHHDARGIELLHHGQIRAEQERASGSKLERWRFQQYEGFQSRHIRWGWGEPGAIVVVSGEEAHSARGWLADLADHWSRVDYCVTVNAGDLAFDPVDQYYATVKARGKPTHPGPKHKRFQELWGGSTYYIGERSSAYYTRVYDKHAESDGDYPKGTWRWECELKRHASEAAQKRAAANELTFDFVLNFIATEMERYQLEVPWATTTRVKRDPQVKHRPDVDRTLAWLERAIKPSVEFACAARGVDAVLETLNLPHIAYVNTRKDIIAPKGGEGTIGLQRSV